MRLDDCRTGRAALNRLRERHYHVVIVDRGLDDIDGLELGPRIRSRGYAGALIMLTGRFMRPEDECDAFAAGFDDYLRKPADAGVLVARIVALAHRLSAPDHTLRGRTVADPEWDSLADQALEVSRDEPMALVFSRPLALTPLEWRIVRALYARRGHVVPWATLVEEGWEGAPPADPVASARKELRRLKRRFGKDARDVIEPVRGFGARLGFWNRK